MKRDGVEPALLEVGPRPRRCRCASGSGRSSTTTTSRRIRLGRRGDRRYFELSGAATLRHCKTGAGTTVRRVNLPPHTQLRVGARVYFVDGWEARASQVDGAYAGRRVRTPTASTSPAARSRRALRRPGRRRVAHTAPSVLLEIGSTLDEHACDESYGVDDVQINVR